MVAYKRRARDSQSPADSTIIRLADHARESINITELTPADGKFIGKHIERGGKITQYPTVAWWRQRLTQVPATIPQLFAYLREARTRNICLIRGAPANLERQTTRRQKAGIVGGRDRGDHGFNDEPTKLFFLDVDGIKMLWHSDPEAAIKRIVAQLGEPWCSTSFVWFFSATHGLALDERKRWTGKISDGKVRVRLCFITERALNADEAIALTNIFKVKVPQLDPSISRRVQPNYIKRPHWVKHPDRDPLGDIPTIGWVKGRKESLAVPDDLARQARWARAQGHNVDIADHPDAEAAVRGIGVDGSIRSHLMSAVIHLINANPVPEVKSFADHSIAIVNQLLKMVETHREHITANLAKHHRPFSDIWQYLPDNQIDWAQWLLDHPGALRRKTIKLIKDKEPHQEDEVVTLEAICARVDRAIARARKGEAPHADNDPFSAYGAFAKQTFGGRVQPLVELIAAPTGSRKSTWMRAAAVAFAAEHPDKSVVILMPRHKLGDEQINLLMKEHQDGDFSAAVWRGRQAWDPEIGNGQEEKMCQRADEAEELEAARLSVDRHLCKQGRGKKAIKCPLFDVCGYQRQKQIEANIWFAAHEMMVHEQPKAFGDIGWLMIDESPLDAFMFGVDGNDKCELALDKLRDEPVKQKMMELALPRNDLYELLDKLKLPEHLGVPRHAVGSD